MKPWFGARRRGAGDLEPVPETSGPIRAPAGTHAVEVADVDGVLVLRAGGSAPLDSAAVFELARTLRRPPAPGSPVPEGPDGLVTVLVVVDSAPAWGRLAELLDSLRENGVRGIRLVMSGAGADLPDRPAVARRIADAWELDVIAPDGTVLLVPGGSLFVPGALRDSGWWRFTPGAEPRPLGPRQPVPPWQTAFGRLPARTVSGTAVDRIPAGVLLRPAATAPPEPGDLCYAVPADPGRPLVLVGVPGAAGGIPAEEVRDVLAELPDTAGFGVRLAPGDHRDLLPAGRLAAAALEVEVEVATAPPMLAGHGMRPRLVGTDGEPSWQPFVEAVVCEPPGRGGERALRLLRWFPPVPGRGSAASGTVRLTEGWQVAVTRAGLWVGAADEPRTPLADRPVDPDGVVIEVGTPGRRLSPSLLPALSRLFATLDPDEWPRATLHLHGDLPASDAAALARLADQHGLDPAGALLGVEPPPRLGAGAGTGVVRSAPAAPPAARPTPAFPPAPISTASAGPRPAAPASRPTPVVSAALTGAPAPTAATDAGGSPSAETVGTRSAPPVPAAAIPPDPLPEAAPTAAVSRRPATAVRSVPVAPPHQSTEAERKAFRVLADPVWEQHSAAVERAMTRIPALGSREARDVRLDLAAVHAYVTAGEGVLGHRELAEGLRLGDQGALAYAACLASGLRRLPSYRGLVVRGGGEQPGAVTPGLSFQEPGPVSAVAPVSAGPAAGAAYAIWSVTGRRVRNLRNIAAAVPDEVVFAPGTSFRELAVLPAAPGGPGLVLLRELPYRPGTPAATGPRALDEQDLAALSRLTQALAPGLPSATPTWPDRCASALGPV